MRVLDLVGENRAIIDSLMFMEKTFKKEEIDLDTLIKVKIAKLKIRIVQIKILVHKRICF